LISDICMLSVALCEGWSSALLSLIADRLIQSALASRFKHVSLSAHQFSFCRPAIKNDSGAILRTAVV
jgi:hypothetical protein